ncbi:MAG TPA: NfeD family protein [Deltaproteobacteria bacterium]|nr:NfeD family protein [Deltaproteobacteria bacterium]HPP80370.1 NfeD family protein [Deltaproteobacteria bacterium]
MPVTVEPWHWLVFGMALLIAELFAGSMVLLWFGLSALVIAILVFLAPALGLTWQLLAWAVCSGLLTVLWFLFLRPKMADRTKAGAGYEALVGETGIVASLRPGESRGTLRFPLPIMGSDEWPFVSEAELSPGDRVVVVDVSGNTLVVKKATRPG